MGGAATVQKKKKKRKFDDTQNVGVIYVVSFLIYNEDKIVFLYLISLPLSFIFYFFIMNPNWREGKQYVTNSRLLIIEQ